MCMDVNVGVSKKVEMKAMAAERMPEPMDNAMKCARYLDMRKLFNRSLTPQELFQLLPTALPITNLVAVNGVPLVGVAQYPLEQWRSMGAAFITQEDWLKIGMLIARHGDQTAEISKLYNLVSLMNKCPKSHSSM